MAYDHYEPVSDLYVRCEGDDSAADGATAVADPSGDDHSSPDPLARIATLLEEQGKRDEERAAAMEGRIKDMVDKAAGTDPETPSKVTEPQPHGAWADEFDHRGYTRGDFEMARMIMDGAGKMKALPVQIEPSERFLNAYHHHVTEDKDHPIYLADPDGHPVRAMDTAESGYGSQLVGAQYVRDMWEAARNADTLVGDIRSIPMTDPTVYVPIDGALPEMLFVGESTSASATAYTTSKTASNRVTLSAKKFTIQQIWSGELDEDSIIAFTPFLRERLNISAGLHLGSAYLNGDTTNAGTGNINLDDANPADTKHYLAWTGIRYYWLVTTTGQGKDMAAALDIKEINVARGKLNGTDDDVDAAVGNINWGSRAADLRLVCDWDTYMNLLDSDKVTTVDKYGPGATIVTGELGRIWGIPIISPSYATKTEADGKCSDTEASNTKGQITLFNPQGWLGGVRRDTQLFFDRIQRTDQFLFELYTRRAFTKFGENVAAGIYDITV
jgi:HK97 family phage major capsid protein